jgi:phage/plasmid-like protein (TIGR03299 family)
MSHEIESNDGMFSVKMVPWHGLGVVLDEPPSIEEGIRVAGLDWEVELQPLFLKDGRETRHFATVRKTDGNILGYVGPSYHVLQNRDAFGWFQPLIESGQVSLETAGSLRGGKRVWVLASTKSNTAEVVPGDPVVNYLLLSNSHDGSYAIRCGTTRTRVVCANTLAMAHSDAASKLIRIYHTKGAKDALEKVREVLDVANSEFLATVEQYKALSRMPVNTRSLKAYVRRVFVPKLIEADATDEDLAEATTCARIVPEVIRLYEEGAGSQMQGVEGTMWGAYNAVTNYLSHERGRTQDARVDSLWFGESKKLNERALKVALQA